MEGGSGGEENTIVFICLVGLRCRAEFVDGTATTVALAELTKMVL